MAAMTPGVGAQEVNPFTNMFCLKCGMILDEHLRNEEIQKEMRRA
jgi:hypothetical protein